MLCAYFSRCCELNIHSVDFKSTCKQGHILMKLPQFLLEMELSLEFPREYLDCFVHLSKVYIKHKLPKIFFFKVLRI